MISLLSALLACAPPTGRDLAVVQDADPEGVEFWSPGGDGAGILPPTPSQDCAMAAAADSGEDALIPDWCVRFSPEAAGAPNEGDDWGTTEEPTEPSDGGEGAGGEGDGGGTTPPCGFYNLLGAVSLGADPERPVALYCDSDLDGGVRFVRYDPDQDEVTAQLIDPGVCYADPMTGAVTELDDGYLLTWVDLDGFAVKASRLGLDGGVFEPAHAVRDLPPARRLTLTRAGDGLVLVLQLEDGSLSAAPVTRSGDLAGPLVSFAHPVNTFAVADLDGRAAVVTCSVDEDDDAGGDVDAYLLAPNAEGLEWAVTLEGSACGYATAPAITGGHGGLLLSWDNGERGRFAVLDAAGGEVIRDALGYDSLSPSGAAVEDGWLVMDATGQATLLRDDGMLLGSWRYPPLADAAGVISGIRLAQRGGTVVTLLLGYDTEPSPSLGHQNTFYYLEQSALAAPTP